MQSHKHNWIVEPVTQTKPSPFRDGDIDGELYTPNARRGNLKGACRKDGCTANRLFHPFTRTGETQDRNMRALLTGSYAPVTDPMIAVKPILAGIRHNVDATPTLA